MTGVFVRSATQDDMMVVDVSISVWSLTSLSRPLEKEQYVFMRYLKLLALE